MRKEADVKKAVKDILTSMGAYWYMPVPTGYGVQGAPDFFVCIGGKFVGIETKFGRGVQTEWQERHEKEIFAAGGVYLLINEKNIGELRAILEGILNLE